MTISRRSFLTFAAANVSAILVSQPGLARAYPARPVRLIVGFPAGGPADIFSRLVAQWLSERLGQQFIVENRPGAGGNIATDAAARAPADGYTLLQLGPPHTTRAALSNGLQHDFTSDIAPIATIVRSANVMVVNPSVPVRSVKEFIAYAKSTPVTINMASSGNGTVTHLAGELFRMLTGVMMTHVPYRGSAPALTDLLAGQVQVMFENVPSSVEHIRNGKLIPLAVTTAARIPALRQVPAMSEYLPGYEASTWFGVGAPKNTPTDVIAMLNREINAGLNDAKIKTRIADLGGEPMSLTPLAFENFIRDETARWTDVIRFAGIKAE